MIKRFDEMIIPDEVATKFYELMFDIAKDIVIRAHLYIGSHPEFYGTGTYPISEKIILTI